MSNTKRATRTRSQLEVLLRAEQAGMQNDLPASVQSIPLNGETLSPPQVEQRLQRGLNAFANVRSAQAAYRKALAEAKLAEAEARVVAYDLQGWLKLQFGATNAPMLAKFGVPASTPRQVSVASKAVGLAKAQATRAAKRAAAAAAAEAATPKTAIVIGANGVELAPPKEPVAK